MEAHLGCRYGHGGSSHYGVLLQQQECVFDEWVLHDWVDAEREGDGSTYHGGCNL